MKVCITLFSMYLLLLCETPCILQPPSEKKDTCCSSSSANNDQKDNSKENHGCNPLRDCSCSQSFVADLPVSPLLISQSVFFTKVFSKQSFHSFFITSIWQPPKVS